MNAEDMVATLLAFSYNVIHGVERLGGSLSDTQREDFLHAWAWIGHILGIPESLNPCVLPASPSEPAFRKAEAALESIAMHLLNPDAASAEVAHHLLHAMAGSPPFVGWTYARHCATSRLLMGTDLADCLRIPATTMADTFLLKFAVLSSCRAVCILASAASDPETPRLLKPLLVPLGRRLCNLHRRVLKATAALARAPA